MSARILIVDDHEVLREGLKSLLAKLRPEWTICGEATDGKEAIQAAQELKPDLMTLDITMPNLSGLEAAAEMRRLGMRFPILIFTTHQSERLAADVQQAGAQGYVLKSQAARNLVLAIDALLADGTFWGSSPENSPAKEQKQNPRISFRRTLVFAT
jgi:DNA-binding NarL/FixJ family response regulator